MLPLPPIAFKIPVPAIVWRAESGFVHDTGTTAADAIRHEQNALGNALGIGGALLAALAAFHASALLWVAFKRSAARRYGSPGQIKIDRQAYVIAEDGGGGFLILFCDDPTTTQTEGDTMEKDFFTSAASLTASPPQDGKPMPDPTAERRADLATHIDQLQTEANAIMTPGGGSARGHYEQSRENFDAKQAEFAGQIEQISNPAARSALGNEKEAQGHEYAGFLAGAIGAYMERTERPDEAAWMQQEAEARKEIAANLRGGNGPERGPTEPAPPERGPEPTGDTITHAEGSRYDALRDTEQAGREAAARQQERDLAASKGEAMPGDPATVAQARPDPIEEEKAKGGGEAIVAEVDGGKIPYRAELGLNIRPEASNVPGGGIETVQESRRLDRDAPFEEPHRPQTPQEKAFEQNAARFEAQQETAQAQGQEPAQTPTERDASPEAVADRQSAASAKEQETELAASKGEVTKAADDTGLTYSEKLQARAEESRERHAAQAEAAPERGEQDHEQASFGRG